MLHHVEKNENVKQSSNGAFRAMFQVIETTHKFSRLIHSSLFQLSLCVSPQTTSLHACFAKIIESIISSTSTAPFHNIIVIVVMEDRHSISEPRLLNAAIPSWSVEITREGVNDPIDTIEISEQTLPPRVKKGKVIWRLPTDSSKTVSKMFLSFMLFSN